MKYIADSVMGNNLNKSGQDVAENEATNERDKRTTSDKIKPDQTLEEFWSEQDGEPLRLVTAVIVGAGLRGQNYANFALDFPCRLKIVGVAEPQDHRRKKLQKLHSIPDEHALDDWSKLAMLDKVADLAIISTQDHMHKDPAIAFANQGYHLLLEKPMAVKEVDCEQIAEACERNKVMAAIGHVMRYVCIYIREILPISGKHTWRGGGGEWRGCMMSFQVL